MVLSPDGLKKLQTIAYAPRQDVVQNMAAGIIGSAMAPVTENQP